MPKKKAAAPPVGDFVIVVDAGSLMKRPTIRAEGRIRISPDGSVSGFGPSPFATTEWPYTVSVSGRVGRKTISLELEGDDEKRVITVSRVLDGKGGTMRLYRDSTWPWKDTTMPIVSYPDLERVFTYLESR